MLPAALLLLTFLWKAITHSRSAAAWWAALPTPQEQSRVLRKEQEVKAAWALLTDARHESHSATATAPPGTAAPNCYQGAHHNPGCSWCLPHPLALPHQPAFENDTYCFHESLGFWKSKLCCLSNIWGLSNQLMIAQSQCSCTMAYPH